MKKSSLHLVLCLFKDLGFFFYVTLGCFGRGFVLGFLFSLEDFGSSRFLQPPRSSFPRARSICVALVQLPPVKEVFSSLGFLLRQICLTRA
jgi:hypothetical protein